MPLNVISLCPLLQTILCSLSLILHIIALPVNYWSHFTARTELGLPEEVGHYGLWGLCSVKAPLYRDDCDPLDTFFRPPHHMLFAGVVASLHAISSGLFLPFAILRIQQIRRNKPNFLIKTKTIIVIKSSLIVIAVSLTLLLTTLREAISREQIIFHDSVLDNYHLSKGWAFWVEVAVLWIDLIVVILCLIENKRLRRLEELGFTAFIANPCRRSLSSFISTSEYFNPNFKRTNHLRPDTDPISTISDPSNDGWIEFHPQNCHLFGQSEDNPSLPSISYNNPAFLNESPDLRNNRRFDNFI